jgi:hypothetical protein
MTGYRDNFCSKIGPDSGAKFNAICSLYQSDFLELRPSEHLAEFLYGAG